MRLPTTAQKLIAFRSELQAVGLQPQLVDDLVKDASRALVMNEGLRVRLSEQPTSDSTEADTTPSP